MVFFGCHSRRIRRRGNDWMLLILRLVAVNPAFQKSGSFCGKKIWGALGVHGIRDGGLWRG